MTIDEAIRHCEEVAEKMNDCECAADHRQLTEWLTELKELREENKVLISECDRLIKEKGELLKKSEQIAEYKRLLKAAVEDITAIAEVHASASPILCPQYGKYMKSIDVRTRKWQYADEALALIGEDGEQNE